MIITAGTPSLFPLMKNHKDRRKWHDNSPRTTGASFPRSDFCYGIWVNGYVNKYPVLPLIKLTLCRKPQLARHFDIESVKSRVLSMIIVQSCLALQMTRTFAGLFDPKVAIRKAHCMVYIT